MSSFIETTIDDRADRQGRVLFLAVPIPPESRVEGGMKLAASILVLAGCGSTPAALDAAPGGDAPAIDTAIAQPMDASPDAPGADLGCLGLPPPTTAPDPLMVEGTLFAVEHYEVTPVAAATVVLLRHGTNAVIAQTTTAADGAFAMTVTSGGVPVDGYFTVAAAGYRATRVEPGDPLSGGENVLMLVADDVELARWYAAANTTFTPGAATLVTASVDCSRDTLDGSTITVAPSPGTVTYYDAPGKKWDVGLAASTNGFSLVTGAASTVTATARLGSTALPPHSITVPANALTIALLTPRS